MQSRGFKVSLHKDSAEQKALNQLMAPKGLFELIQDEYTHRNGLGLSRIDRIYSNFGQAAQLDHRVECRALQWPAATVSAHKPLLFSCRAPKGRPSGATQLDPKTINDPNW